MDITAFYKVTYGLYIISTKGAGCIVNTLTQVTAEPIKMSVAINKNNITEQQIEKAGVFSAVALAQDAPMKLIGDFGFKSSKDMDKFANYKTALDANGVPYVTENTVAQFTLKLLDKLDLGTHVMLIGEVTDAQKLLDAPPLTYEYYQMVKRGLTPKNAPSYKGQAANETETKKSGWRCTVCGYIYEGDPLPENFICPICGRGPEVFVKI